MTFSPHAKVFFGQEKNFLINSDSEKAECIAEQGIERLYQIPFNANFAALSPTSFLDALVHALHVKYLLVGDDFRFGYKGQGDFALLTHYCDQHDVSVQQTPTIDWQGERVSSSRIRTAIKASDFTLIKQLMGRALTYRGVVQSGQRLGRTIDFPTANIHLPESRLLPNGVFAARVNIEGDSRTYHGMCNIGTRPTVTDDKLRKIEVNIFAFNSELYGKTLTVEPVEKIRNEQKFTGVDALVAQLRRDREHTLSVLQ